MPGQPQSMDKKNKKEALQVQKDIVKDSLNKADDMLNLPQSTSLGNVNQQSKPAMNPEQHQLSQSLSSFQRPSMYYNWRSFSYTDIDDDDDDHHETLDDLENGEEFLPSSLDELLTPLERRRKHSSRTSSISSAFTLSPTTTTTTRKLPSIQPLNKTDMESSTITVKPHEEDSTQFDLDLDLEF
ncbi:hypothetical protein E3P92_00761 [Wallemia ichthyophaga]|uniref:Uncharacterized protein n=2 Tax=Wallemia ichthyophaga TaxID=245174 RepID=A0A4T0K282_WALIC|nr:uncharacterized protein J056_003923 [Wallemia ichthyophaga EXF-994]TIA75630.1 hypothetical protein E3P91_00370 [Wallemia ichthyophaga]EOR01687.1 hypothetical protein J056_003923 [Wallemia ichthyophaga EXF-994]TIA83491.1 hypothetical protein E3P98_00742 [Wallemia ichthyophaga]TIA93907.1 hypothetical protein E3P97_00667 [Wallemia ichthyophaga]TIB03117.1 hypothetical protein E3P95_00716 [Wallemia ichthyophaga]